MSKPRLLDLFCGAGGAAEGYYQAGFEVVGVDSKPQPHYPFEFLQGDALWILECLVRHGSIFPEPTMHSPTDEPRYWLSDFAAIHASPPCQADAHLRRARWPNRRHPRLLLPVRRWLQHSELPYIIENVPGADLIEPQVLCGSMFGLGVRRHRLFETSFPTATRLRCAHQSQGPVVGVYGHPGGSSKRDGVTGRGSTADWSRAMGIDWMTARELAEAIPPAYTEHIGAQLLAVAEQALRR